MEIEDKIEKNKSLKELTTFRIGGPARFFVAVNCEEELLQAVEWAGKKQEAIFILGGGSNILVSDLGVSGLVIKITNKGAEVKGERIICGAGGELTKILLLAKSHSLAGLEWAIGIPGTIGGAIRGNAGAFGHNIGESIETVKVFDMKNKRFENYSRNFCGFAYRDSIFKQKSQYIIWETTLKLVRGENEKIGKRIAEILESRSKTQPRLPSAGSVFKNLDKNIVVTKLRLSKAIKEREVEIKDLLGAGLVIDLAGCKGKKCGDAKVSLEHANFVVNSGSASANDVKTLIAEIKKQVKEKFDVSLEEEIQYFGA